MKASPCLLLLLLAACPGPWPGRPPRYPAPIDQPMAAPSAEAQRILAVFKSGPNHKFFLIGEPDWQLVRSELGIVTGRRSTNAVIGEIERSENKQQGWPDLCVYRQVVIQEDAGAAGGFERTRSWGEQGKGEVDCTEFDAR